MAKDKVLVVGGGGREHALAWKLAQSPYVRRIAYTKENAGLAGLVGPSGEPVSELVELKKPEDVAKYAKENDVSLVVVGSENDLATGIADICGSMGVKAFGPSKEAAQLETSKVYTKRALEEWGVPTADFDVFDNPGEATAYIWNEHGRPLVIKADGLAAGKGAVVCKNPDTDKNSAEQIATVKAMMLDKVHGDAGNRIVIEDCMVGEEASILAFVDGKTIKIMVPTQDHKPAYDNDEGPNTGGMGAYGPAPVVTPEVLSKVYQQILAPTVEGMSARGIPFKGCLYAGLMITKEGPKVVEYNIRFGDPEAQPTLMLTATDIYPVMHACVDGTLDSVLKGPIETRPGIATGVVMASLGYPGKYEKGKAITGLDAVVDPNVYVFHAGTKEQDGKILTAGGRVLCVTAWGNDFEDSIRRAYENVRKIEFEGGAQFRTDIGKKALDRVA